MASIYKVRKEFLTLVHLQNKNGTKRLRKPNIIAKGILLE